MTELEPAFRVYVLREVSYDKITGIQLLKLSADICIVPLQNSFEEVVAYTGSIDLLKVTEIVLLTETSAAPSSGETAVTVGAGQYRQCQSILPNRRCSNKKRKE